LIIKAKLNDVEMAMDIVSAVVSDKLLQEENKNLVVWLKDGDVNFVAHNGNTIGMSKVLCEVEWVGVQEETFIQLRAKDILDVLTSLKGLKRTKVESIELHIKPAEAQLHVFETAISPDMDNAGQFNQTSKYRITKTNIKDVIKNDIQNVNTAVEGVQLEVSNAMVFIDALLPTVSKETREASLNVMFGESNYYSVLNTYVAVMPNKLLPEFSGFRLTNSTLSFLKSFISVDPEAPFTFRKEEKGNGLVHLTVKKNDSVALIKCADLSKAFDITNFLGLPDNGIVMDKMYLIDVLKRVNNISDAVFIEVKVDGGEGSFEVKSKSMTQKVPVMRSKGKGEYNFSIRADLLSSVIFSHATYFDSSIFMYFDTGGKGNIIMACADNSKLWHTKMTGLSSSKGDFAWN